MGIIEGLDAEVIARAKQPVLPFICDGEGKVTQEMVDASILPAPIRGEHEVGVGRLARRVSQRAGQILPGVEPQVADESQTILAKHSALRRPVDAGPEQPLAEAACVDRLQGVAVRRAVREARQHGLHNRPVTRRAAAFGAIEAANGCHQTTVRSVRGVKAAGSLVVAPSRIVPPLTSQA